jgi:hypothetical protein
MPSAGEMGCECSFTIHTPFFSGFDALSGFAFMLASILSPRNIFLTEKGAKVDTRKAQREAVRVNILHSGKICRALHCQSQE